MFKCSPYIYCVHKPKGVRGEQKFDWATRVVDRGGMFAMSCDCLPSPAKIVAECVREMDE